MKPIATIIFWFLLLATSVINASSDCHSVYAGGGAGAAAGEASGLVASLEELSLREGESWRRSDLAINTIFAEQKELCPKCCHENYRPPKPCSFCHDNERNRLGPLTRAVKTGCEKNVLEALDAEGRTDERGESGCTPLHYAAVWGHIGLFKILFMAGSKINETDLQGATALHHAAAHGQDESVLTLLRIGADASIKTTIGQLDAYAFALKGLTTSACSAEVLETLRLACTQQNTTTATSLCKAVRDGSLTRVALLLSQGADPNACDDDRREVPLIWAQYNNTKAGVRIITMLVRAGADPNALDKFGQSALHHAANEGRHRCAVALINAGANVNTRLEAPNAGYTPLHFAALQGHYQIVKALLDAGADKTICNASGARAIDYARAKGHTKITALLESWEPSMAFIFRHNADRPVERAAVTVGSGCATSDERI